MGVVPRMFTRALVRDLVCSGHLQYVLTGNGIKCVVISDGAVIGRTPRLGLEELRKRHRGCTVSSPGSSSTRLRPWTKVREYGARSYHHTADSLAAHCRLASLVVASYNVLSPAVSDGADLVPRMISATRGLPQIDVFADLCRQGVLESREGKSRNTSFRSR